MTSGDYEARHLTQRRPAIILRQGAVAVLWSFPLQLQPPESAQLNGCGAARCGLFRGVGVTRDIGSVRRRRPTTTTCLWPTPSRSQINCGVAASPLLDEDPGTAV